MQIHLLVFRDIVDAMAYGVLVFSVIEIYLMLNKLWSRKHIREVSDSISVSGRVVGLIPLSIFTLNYVLNNQWQGVIEGLLWLFAGIIQLLIGIGIWVAGNNKIRLGKLFRRAIRKERSEMSFLAKAIFSTHAQEKVLDILGGIALIDGELDLKEKEYVESLAKQWHTKVIWGAIKARHKKAVISPFYNVWEDLSDYLSHNPSSAHLELLSKAVRELILVDGVVTPNERIVLDEFDFIMDDNKKLGMPLYEVLIVPQKIEQEHYLSSQFSSLTKKEAEGGWAFSTIPFRSKTYSERVKQEFQEHGYFTTIAIV